MKSLIYLSVFLFSFSKLLSQEIIFEKKFDNKYKQQKVSNAIIIDSNRFCVTFSDSNYRINLHMFDNNFNEIWESYTPKDTGKTPATKKLEVTSGSSLFLSNDTIYYFTGYSKGIFEFDNTLAIFKTNSKFIGNSYGNRVYNSLSNVTLIGDYILMPNVQNYYSYIDYFKKDKYKFSILIDTFPNNFIKTIYKPYYENGKIYISGKADLDSASGEQNIYFMILDTNGQIEKKNICGNFNNLANSSNNTFEQLNNSTFILLCPDWKPDNNLKCNIAIFNIQGELILTKEYYRKNRTYLKKILPTKDGNFILYGYDFNSTDKIFDDTTTKFLAVKMSPKGDIIWEKSWGYPLISNVLNHALELKEGEYTFFGACGIHNSWEETGNHMTSLYIATLRDSLALNVKENEYSEKIMINPNPVKDILQIESPFDIKKIEIYAITGDLVLNSETTEKIDVSKLQRGSYFLYNYLLAKKSSEKVLLRNSIPAFAINLYMKFAALTGLGRRI